MQDKNKPPLRIGKIAYTNLFPIFYMLEKGNLSEYEIIDGFPSALNRMLRNGEIDISPSSSIEYLRYPDYYTIIEGHSISSKGPIRSIFLFSKRPIEELEGMTILTTSQSETSVGLLDIILKKFYKIACSLQPINGLSDLRSNEKEAFLLIGDDALKAKKTIFDMYVYDLGDVWYKHTGLPFVFALWIARKDSHSEKPELFEKFIHDLNTAKKIALEHLDEIAKEWKLVLLNRYSLSVTEEELIFYWRGISYDFGDEHRRGLELFRQYSEELGLLNKHSQTDR
ncbi:MAG: menaquinone biosynthesis protein [Nitrospirae bacterium]|nr:menaquinone biosynthesis protein [Nitrospirota bacterium]